MKIRVLIATALLCLLCGCAYTEPNAQYTVTALGFDVQDGRCETVLQAIDAAGGEKNGQPVTFTVNGWGDNVRETVEDIKSQLSKKPSFKHCQLVLVSQGIAEDTLSGVIELCEELDISLRTRLASCEDIEGVLKNGKISSGTDLAALIKQNSEAFGYGAHTAIFEISTALLAAEGDFALPVLESAEGGVSVEGLLRYIGGEPQEYLSVEDSIRYAKENNIYEGEDR